MVYDSVLGKLIITNTDGSFYYVDPTTGTETLQGMITGVTGNGDFGFITPVPEPAAGRQGLVCW